MAIASIKNRLKPQTDPDIDEQRIFYGAQNRKKI